MWRLCGTIFTFVLIWNPAYSLYKGDACQNPRGSGVCQLIKNCPRAQNRAVLATITRCGSEGRNPIVCCPNLDSNTQDSTTQVSRTQDSTTQVSRTENERISSRECRITSTKVRTSLRRLIIGGERAVENEFPHMAALGYRPPLEAPHVVNFVCGGILISRRYVLTAAHCIQERLGTLTTVRMGTLTVTNYTEASDYGVENTIVHSNYSSKLNYDDIALVRINRDASYTVSIQPACLHNDSSPVTSSMTITGWGMTDANRRNSVSSVLLKATVTPVNNTYCGTFYDSWKRKLPRGLDKGQLCATHNVSDTCEGDSGGPLQIKHPNFDMYSVVGITSFGRSCGTEIPGVYTRVSEYLDWIESHVWPQN